MHLVGFIVSKFVTMHGHVDVKLGTSRSLRSGKGKACLRDYLHDYTVRQYYQPLY